MLRFISACAAALAMALIPAGSRADGPGEGLPTLADGPLVASHDAGFFQELLFGRVRIIRAQSGDGSSQPGTFTNGFGVFYFVPTGKWKARVVGCWIFPNGRTINLSRDRDVYVSPSIRHRAQQGGSIPVYDPETGTFGNYLQHPDDPGRIYAGAMGWVQDSWPVVAQRRCKDIPPDEVADLPVNETQNGSNWDKLRRQDPDAVMRGFMADSPPLSIPVREFIDQLSELDGQVFVCHRDGSTCTVFEQHGEIWLNNPKTGWFNTARIEVDEEAGVWRQLWRKSDHSESPLDGWYPVFQPTGEMHRVAIWIGRMTDAAAPPVPLPDGWGTSFQVKFHGDLSAVIDHPDGSQETGRWRLRNGWVELRSASGKPLGEWDAKVFPLHLRKAGIVP